MVFWDFLFFFLKVIFWGFESPKNTFLDFPLLGDPFLNLFLFGALKHNFPYFNLYDSYKKFHTVKIKNIKKGVGPSDGGEPKVIMAKAGTS